MSRADVIAILSDIHANLEALQAVLDDIAGRSVDQIVCLGDVVGYGPDPDRCVEIVACFDFVLTGDVDQRVLSDSYEPPEDPRGQRLLRWTRSQLGLGSREFLVSRPTCRQSEGATFAHASPLDYTNDYLFPEQVYDSKRMRLIFDQFDGRFFCGHTHIAGIHSRTEYISPATIDYRFSCSSSNVVINAGSVGQPRDGDQRAGYVLFDGQVVEFMRLDYDIETTKRKLDDLGLGPPYWDI